MVGHPLVHPSIGLSVYWSVRPSVTTLYKLQDLLQSQLKSKKILSKSHMVVPANLFLQKDWLQPSNCNIKIAAYFLITNILRAILWPH